MRRRLSRRTVLAGGLAALAGCLGGPSSGSSGGGPTDETDGYPPRAGDAPGAQEVNTAAFERVPVEGVLVPLAPVDVAHYWHQRREARFVDARGESSYDRAHLVGAVWSPAPDGREDDPVDAWPQADRIVCYCGCPHHLSSLRAASLIDAGYEEVYVIDEGFYEWRDRGYPLAGSDVTSTPARYEIRGQTDPRHAGASAWAWHDASGQREATPIGADGAFVLHLRFADVDLDSPVRVVTPGYEVEAPLRSLVSGVVTG